MRPLQNKLKVKVKSYKVACALKSRGRHGAGPLFTRGYWTLTRHFTRQCGVGPAMPGGQKTSRETTPLK